MKITLTKVSTKNLAALAQRIISSSKNDVYQIVEQHPLLLALEAEYGIYDKLYAKFSYSGKGVAVATADRNRDTPYTAITGITKIIAGSETLPNHQQAVAVWEVIKSYGTDLDRLSYAEETAQMKKLIEALDTEEMQENLTALNLLPTYNQLKQAQIDFEKIYAEQAEANAELRGLPSATSARKQLEKALRDYLNLLTAMRSLPDWSNLYNEINEMVKAAK
jgi:uncharacterized protein YbaR (Trm112 family)